MDDFKPDTTSQDYRAGEQAGKVAGESKARRDMQGKLSRLAREIKEGKHRLDALGALREVWRRMKG